MMALTVRATDGVVTRVSSWSAWRTNITKIRQRPCHACDGEGHVEQIAMRAGGKGWRWYRTVCPECKGWGREEVR